MFPRLPREDNEYWCDVYDSKKALEGTSALSVCYEDKTRKFALARYVFPAFMDTRKVRDVIDMVGRKYGKPGRNSGNYDLGQVTADWSLTGGIEIGVNRGWPDTTVYLENRDPARLADLRREMKESEDAEKSSKVKKQSQAF